MTALNAAGSRPTGAAVEQLAEQIDNQVRREFPTVRQLFLDPTPSPSRPRNPHADLTPRQLAALTVSRPARVPTRFDVDLDVRFPLVDKGLGLDSVGGAR